MTIQVFENIQLVLSLSWLLCSFSLGAQPLKQPTPTAPIETSSISSNPAAVDVTTGSGALQQYLQKKLGIHDNHGIAMQGAWIGDTNGLFSGGIENAQKSTSNSVGLLGLNVDMEKLNGWNGGVFNAQFLQRKKSHAWYGGCGRMESVWLDSARSTQ